MSFHNFLKKKYKRTKEKLFYDTANLHVLTKQRVPCFFNFVPEKPVRTIKCSVERKAYKFTNHLSVLSILYRLSAKSPILSNLILIPQHYSKTGMAAITYKYWLLSTVYPFIFVLPKTVQPLNRLGWKGLTEARSAEKEVVQSEVAETEWRGGWGSSPSPHLFSILPFLESSSFVFASLQPRLESLVTGWKEP